MDSRWSTVVAVAVTVLLLAGPTTTVRAESVDCGAVDSADKKCEATLYHGQTFSLDCSAASNTYRPTALGESSLGVCSSSASWTSVETTCPSGDEVTALTLLLQTIPLTNAGNVIKIVNAQYGGEEKKLNGSCQSTDKSKGAYFNVTIKPSSAAFPNLDTRSSFILAGVAASLLALST